MIDDPFFDEMDLPLRSPNEELETISNNRFKPLLDVTKFEIREENFRDKGIDFHIELKKANHYLNLRFAIQLKATDSNEKNSDGSISLKLHTSNINYLLNNGWPAYYVLYSKAEDSFYYENLNEFAKSLYGKNANWQQQKTHVLRFNKKMQTDVLQEMYDYTFKRGKFFRKLNETLIQQSSSLAGSGNIVVDANLDVVGDEKIRSLIENIGLVLINEGKWQEILLVHKRTSQSIATTAKYNLVLGAANYYGGNLLDACSFFKASIKLQNELSDELKKYLLYFDANVRYSLGIINKEAYDKKMAELENDDVVGLYIKLEKAKTTYYHNLIEPSDIKFDKLKEDINAIINDPKADYGVIANAKCELILIEGNKNNWDHVQQTAIINATEIATGPDKQLRIAAAQRLAAVNSSWFKNNLELKSELFKEKNYFAYYMATINEVKVIYEMAAMSSLITLEQNIPGVPNSLIADMQPFLKDLLEKVEKALEFFRHIGHIENEVVALCLKYEILHFLCDFAKAANVLIDAENLVEVYDITEKKRRLEYLKNAGTTHERLKALFEDSFQKEEEAKAECQNLVAEMQQWDTAEREAEKVSCDCYHIDLFPIGIFKFPKSYKDEVYAILNIKRPETKEIFESMFGQVIPIANIYHSEILQEGIAEGGLADKGIKNWRNIHRIRKAFYENKFYRNDF